MELGPSERRAHFPPGVAELVFQAAEPAAGIDDHQPIGEAKHSASWRGLSAGRSRFAAHLLPPGAPIGMLYPSTGTTFAACGPLGPSATSYSTAWPWPRVRHPCIWIALWWRNTSWAPSSGVMKP